MAPWAREIRRALDHKATAISLLVVQRADGQKLLLALKAMGGRAATLGAASLTI
jgi:hypothetical protein